MFIMTTVVIFSSCASKKTVSGIDGSKIENAVEQKQNKEVFDKIIKGNVQSDALTSKMKFTIQSAQKSMSVSGQLELKNDKYIRIRLTPMGLFEVAMIEFTVDYVLVLDRMHKEYIKASYAQVPFLQANGIDFYALQSLFRNTLFVPGEKNVDESSYKQFKLNQIAGQYVFTANKGHLNYNWFVDNNIGKINKAEFTYVNNNSKSKLNCYYSDFSDVEGKKFPHKLSLNFITDLSKDLSNLTLNVSARSFKAEQKGKGEITSIPRKYSEKDVREMLNKILEVK